MESIKGQLTSTTSIVVQDNKAVVKIDFTLSDGRHIDFTCPAEDAMSFGATLVNIGIQAQSINQRSA